MTKSSAKSVVDTGHDSVGGIVAMCLAMVCFIVSDVFSKLAAETLPVGEVILLRGLMTTALFTVPALAAGTIGILLEKFSRAWAMRVFGEMAAAILFISALAHLPIANVVSITQTVPLAMTAVAAVVLGEVVGWRRWIATAAGFCGVLLIAKPGTAGFSWWSLAALGTVGAIIVRDIATRRMDKSVPVMLITLTTAIGVSIAGLGLSAVEGAWQQPSAMAWAYLAGGAAAVGGAYHFSIQAVRKAQLSTVAPFRYTIVPLSLVAGYLVWRDIPDVFSLLGIAIIAGAGLYTFLAEMKRR
jgi:drug/metabolite transporter (DMT)-like permease